MTPTTISRTLSAGFLAAGVLATGTLLPQASFAHPSGPQSYSEPNGMVGRASSCRNAHNQVKRIFRDQARAHCRSSHDSGSNALQRTNYQRGTCIKTKPPGQKAFYEIQGAVYTATCR